MWLLWIWGLLTIVLLAALGLLLAVRASDERRNSAQKAQFESRLSSLATALVKFSSGDLLVSVKGKPGDSSVIEDCIREFNDITTEPCRRAFYVGSDSLLEGTLAGKTIGEHLRHGRLAVLVGSHEGVNFELRRKGALASLKENFPEIKESAVLETRGDPDLAYAQTLKLLQSDPQLKGIYVTEGASPSGVARAVKDSGKLGQVQIFAHDVTPATMDAMEKGAIAATIFQDPFAQGFDPVVRLFNQLTSKDEAPLSRFVTLIRVVTLSNSGEFWDPKEKKSRAGDLNRLAKPLSIAGQLRIAVIGLGDDGFWAEVKSGVVAARQALKAQGCQVDWIVPAGKDEPDRIAHVGEAIRGVVTQKYDALAVPLHDRRHIHAVNEAVAGGLAVATYNSEPLSFRQTLSVIADQSKRQILLSTSLDEQSARGERAAGHIDGLLASVSDGLENQKQQVLKTGTDLKMLSQTLGTIDRAARTSAETTEKVSEAAQLSFQASRDNVVALTSLGEAAQAISRSVNELREETARIAENISFIGDVANQTNTLAINASIEAARAGLSGKGFAVIAGEIRHLSDEANRAATSIAELLESVETKAELVAATTRQSSEQTQRSQNTATRSERALEVIREAARESESQMKEILGAVERVTEFRTGISAMVETLQNANQEWDSAVQASLAAAAEMGRVSAKIAVEAKTLSDRTASQEGMLRQFKLAD